MSRQSSDVAYLRQSRVTRDVYYNLALLVTPVLRYSEESDSSTFDPALRSTSEPASGSEIALTRERAT